MREKVEHIAKGNFDITNMDMHISVDQIQISAVESMDYHGEFLINSNSGIPIKGIIVSSSRMLYIEQREFISEKFIVRYKFMGKHSRAKQEFNGHITIISNGGEVVLPFYIKVVAKSISTELGEIKDLFQYANLAQKNWPKACSIFISKDFPSIFLKKKPQLAFIYKNLLKSSSKEQALDEFLQFQNKKGPVELKMDQDTIVIPEDLSVTQFVITIKRSAVGYISYKVHTDLPYLRLNKKNLYSDDFINKTCQLIVDLDMEEKHNYSREGLITIENMDYHHSIKVGVQKRENKNEDQVTHDNIHKEKKKHRVSIIESYLSFRTNQIDQETYVATTLTHAEALLAYEPDEYFFIILTLHMKVMGEDSLLTKQGIEDIDEEHIKEQPLLLSYFYYVKALYFKTPSVIEEAVKIISDCYEQSQSYFCFLMLLYIDEKYIHNKQLVYDEIKTLYQLGNHSPLLYYELCDIFNHQPTLLRDLKGLERNTLAWGNKYNFVSPECIHQFTSLVSRAKTFDPLLFRLLYRFYHMDQRKEYLTVLCGFLIKGSRIDGKYNQYYRKGIEESIKLVGINEYYIKSLAFDEYTVLPHSVLLYFTYSDNLNDTELSYLYANIIYNQSTYQSVYASYHKRIDEFIERQIKKGSMSENLIYLYRNQIHQMLISGELAAALPNVLFKQRIVCKKPGITGFIVGHLEDSEIHFVPLHNQIAYVDIYTDNYMIMLIDEQGRHYINNKDYQMEELFDVNRYIDLCFEYNKKNPMVLLKLCRETIKEGSDVAESIFVAQSILKLPKIQPEVRIKIIESLINYYYENYEGDILEEYLLKIDLAALEPVYRGTILEHFIVRGMYPLAFMAVEEYGSNFIDAKKLCKLASHMLKEGAATNKVLLDICMEAFRGNKYDQRTLYYLQEYYVGSIRELIDIWKVTMGYGLEAATLEENILAQSLFCNIQPGKIFDVFDSYYTHPLTPAVVRAFILYHSYHAFIGEECIPCGFYNHLRYEIEKGTITDDLSKMALLQAYTTWEDDLMEEDKNIIESLSNEFIKNNMVLPFFQKLKDIVLLPVDIQLKTYIQYKSNQGKSVHIRYHYEKDNQKVMEYKEEEMIEVLPGIYVIDFLLFQDESLSYYILEQEEEELVITESNCIQVDSFIHNSYETRFNALNLILISKEMKEDDTVSQLTKQYSKNTYVLNHYMKIL